jgi:hypothetical protein
MFDVVFENLKKATDMTLQMQQEMFKKWTSFWPGTPSVPNWSEQAQKFQKKWAEFYEEILKRQRDTLETQFKASLKNIEEAFHLADSKSPDELKTKTLELWQKVFDALRQSYEVQVREFQATIAGWTELVTKGAA